jgi:uncharacterized membrane protein YiaA
MYNPRLITSLKAMVTVAYDCGILVTGFSVYDIFMGLFISDKKLKEKD